MKKVFLSVLLLSVFSLVFAQTSGAETVVLPDYTSMVMDVVSYDDTIYEAILALSSDDDDDPYNIFINRYKDTEYVSTISIDIPPEQFTTGEFRENRSHYEHLRVFPVSEDEICVTVYSCFSNCHFTFLRIRNDEIVSKKTYNLRNTSSYESTSYSYDGKDRIYFSYNGQEKFSETGWDNWIMAFDLDGNLKAYKKLFTSDSDSILDLCSFPDYVYVNCDFGVYSKNKAQAVLKLSPDLELLEIYPYNLKDLPVHYLDLYNSPNKLILSSAKSDKKGNRVNFKSVYDSELNFEGTFTETNLFEKNMTDNSEPFGDSTVYISSKNYSDDGFEVLGAHDTWENILWKSQNPVYYDYFKYTGFYAEGYRFTDPFEYGSEKRVFMNGKFFISGYWTNSSGGISKVSFHTVLKDKVSAKDLPYEYEQIDLNLFAEREDFAQKADDLLKIVMLKDADPVEEESLATASVIKLPWMYANPDAPEILKTVPSLPFSER